MPSLPCTVPNNAYYYFYTVLSQLSPGHLLFKFLLMHKMDILSVSNSFLHMGEAVQMEVKGDTPATLVMTVPLLLFWGRWCSKWNIIFYLLLWIRLHLNIASWKRFKGQKHFFLRLYSQFTSNHCNSVIQIIASNVNIPAFIKQNAGI